MFASSIVHEIVNAKKERKLHQTLPTEVFPLPKKRFAAKYLSGVSELINSIDLGVVETIIDALLHAIDREGTLYFLGNGGSAATASHYANDFRIGTQVPGQKPFNAVSLADNSAIITALGNDEGYEYIFVRQLEGLLKPVDVVFALSVSGNSINVLNAIEYAKEIGATTISCTGFDGGKLKRITDVNLHIPTNYGDYGPVEDLFAIIGHLLYSYIKLSRMN